jgi:hypothetical protein
VARRWAGLPVVAPVSRSHAADDEPFRLTWPEN